LFGLSALGRAAKREVSDAQGTMQISGREVVNYRRIGKRGRIGDGRQLLLDGEGNERLEKILLLRGRFGSTFTR